MRPADFAWGALVITGTALETWALTTDRHHYTLSVAARRALRCHTDLGRNVTIAAVGAGATWLAHHLVSIPAPMETP